MKILFLGDSITEGFNTKRLLSKYDITNKGVSGYNTNDIINFLDANFISQNLFDFIFLSIGTNDIAQGKTDEEIIINIQKIIYNLQEKQSKSEIILTSIFPTLKNEPRPNKRIDRLNEKIYELAQQNDLMYLNLHPHFLTDSGELKEEYSLDGLHLRKLAYRQWAALFDEFMKQFI
ncbi:MAG: hypothetical protein JW866_00595 [Ignavibacteriales bacterium]|nr:hypothetical protein [Ignavibacteriales bacterium]